MIGCVLDHHKSDGGTASKPNNSVFVSAGTRNLRPNEVGRGGLLKNTLAGAGGPEDWQIIAGGPSAGTGTFAGLPDAQIHAFIFDVKSDRRGVFAGVRNHGIYYARINPDGTLDGSFNNGQFAKITDADLDAVIPTSSTGGHHYYSRLMFDPDSADHLYVSRHWPAGGVFRIKLVSDRTTLDPANCIVRVEEVITGRMIGSAGKNITRGIKENHASEVINLLVTPRVSGFVFAGVTCGHGPDSSGINYTGGLIRWAKNSPSGTYEWRIGGPTAIGPSSKTIAIGGLAQDPLDSNTILAVTYRFNLRADRFASSNKYQGEDNYKLMNLWQSTNAGESFSSLDNSVTQHQWPDAVTMAFFPSDPDKIIMPTHGNGVWIGTRSGTFKALMSPHSAAVDENLPRHFALHPSFPNPFNPATVIEYDLPKATHVRLIVYDVLGHRVKILVDRNVEAGYQSVVWDGKREDGRPVAAGIYFYRLHTADFSTARKMTLLR